MKPVYARRFASEQRARVRRGGSGGAARAGGPRALPGRSVRRGWITTGRRRACMADQESAFRAQIELARELDNKPLVIHTRAAEDDTPDPERRAGCTGGDALLHDSRSPDERLAAGWWISCPLATSRIRRTLSWRRRPSACPRKGCWLMTDAPYRRPRWCASSATSRRSSCIRLGTVVERRGSSPAQLEAAVERTLPACSAGTIGAVATFPLNRACDGRASSVRIRTTVSSEELPDRLEHPRRDRTRG